MQKVSGLIRIELAQYKEMAVFARFGSDADSVTKRILERGECLMTLLKQPAGSPYSLSEEVILLLAYRENIFDGIPADSMIAAREEIMEYVKNNAGGLLSQIAKTGDMTSDTEDELASVLEKWKKSKHWL
jgi:F-type H+-transporting ATPase subunit alpha